MDNKIFKYILITSSNLIKQVDQDRAATTALSSIATE